VAERSWDGHRRLSQLAVAAAVVLTVLSPPIGIVVDLAVAVRAHRTGARFVRNVLIVLAIADLLWLVLGVGGGDYGTHPLG
jgi:hypothetical protein